MRLPNIAGLSFPAQWSILGVLSLTCAVLLMSGALPAAMLLGPMLAAITFTVCGGALRISGGAFALAQGVIGWMIAKFVLPLSLAHDVGARWPLFMVGVISVIVASGLLGWLMTALKLLPGTTVLWGLSSGAATVMTIMAEDFGADSKLVAFMNICGVILAILTASLVARFCGIAAGPVIHSAGWFAPVAWLSLAETLALAILGSLAARWLRIPAGALLVPLICGVVAARAGWLAIVLPPWLLATAYAVIGWRIGLQFRQPELERVTAALPRILISALALIAVCAGIGGLMSAVCGIDPLTAYLATSPGGADTVAIIASSSGVDKPLVMTMQLLRALAVLFAGPALAGFIAKQIAPLPTERIMPSDSIP